MIPHVTAPTFRPPTYETNHARPVVGFDAPCVCGRVVPWTATPGDGAVPHCSCSTEGEAA